jgi:hypothetical protein
MPKCFTCYFTETSAVKSEPVSYDFGELVGANTVKVVYSYLDVYSDEAKTTKIGLLTLTSTIVTNDSTEPPLTQHNSCLATLFIDATSSTVNFDISTYGTLLADGEYLNRVSGATNQFKKSKKVCIKVASSNGKLKLK